MAQNGGKVRKEKRAFFKNDCGGIVEHEGGYAVCRICGDNECAQLLMLFTVS
jgi:hypothetical protein